MRALPSVFLALVLLVGASLAGCLQAGTLGATTEPPHGIVLAEVPAGATVETLDAGVRLVWEKVELPFRQEVAIPAGTVLVRAVGDVGGEKLLSVGMREAGSERRRCQTPFVESWTEPTLGSMACIGLALVDPLPAKWVVLVSGQGPAKVSVEFLQVPLEGPAARLDLTQLSMPSYYLLETEAMDVESFDGTPLHVEVTRPATDEPVPAIIVSSPYNNDARDIGRRPSDDLIRDWGARGYAIVVADVRGYGESGGCVEVWGINEQKDQAWLVDWVASQPWSDGSVGFYGQSYVATTPVAAAVQAPEALKAIVAVAPVINAYDDWHFGGVPNGEDVLSPVAYQVSFGVPAQVRPADPLRTALNHANGLCDPTLVARAGDPRAIYDAFYEERNFSARAADVRAAVLFTQGFEDRNVKSAMIDPWFNAITAPKLGLFGHWVHQHPVRADQELLFLAWMDQYVKGRPLGFENVPPVSVIAQDGTVREAQAWPPLDAEHVPLWLGLGKGTLSREPVDGFALLQMDPTGGVPLALPTGSSLLAFETTLEEPLTLAGTAHVDVSAHVERGENGYLAAFLYDGDRLVTWGMFNLAHHEGHDTYNSLRPGQTLRVSVPLLPTEHAFAEGSRMRLEVRGALPTDWAGMRPTQPTALGLHGGEDGSALVLPVVAPGAPVGPILDWRA